MAEKKVSYQVDGRPFEGMIVYDEAVTAKRPVVFMQPDWKGVCADTIGQARAVAGKDYVVLMADMFGSGYGAKPKTVDELRAGMLAVHNNLPFTLACGGKAYDALSAEAQKLGVADAAKVLAIGYCAGGGYALEQARAGADFKALVVFHVTNPEPGRRRHALQHQGPRFGDPRRGRSGDAEADDGRVRRRTDQGQGGLAGDDVRSAGRAFVLRSDRHGAGNAVRRKTVPQILPADARLFHGDAVMPRAGALGLRLSSRQPLSVSRPRAPKP